MPSLRQCRPAVRALFIAALAGGVVTPFDRQAQAASPERKRVRTHRVYGPDDRQPVFDATQPPWSALGMIVSHWGAGEVRTGTGVLISDHVVLTCAHVVNDTGIGWADGIFFIPGKNGPGSPFGSFRVVESITTPEWAATQDDAYDLAMLVLDRPAGSDSSIMRVAGQPPPFFEDRVLSMSGYPADLIWDRLFSATGEVFRIRGNELNHYIDGGSGQSGAPMWFNDPTTGQASVAGVYTGDIDVIEGGIVLDTYGYGIHINADFCGWIEDYVQQHDPGAETVDCTNAANAPPASGLDFSPCGAGLAGVLPFTAMVLQALSRQRRAPGKTHGL